MSLLDNLPHTATAKRRVRTSVNDGAGGSRDSFETVFSDRACWLQPAGDSKVLEFKNRGVDITDKVYFTSNPAIGEQHVLTVNGNTYDVVSFAEPDASAGLGKLWRVFVNRKTTRGVAV